MEWIPKPGVQSENGGQGGLEPRMPLLPGVARLGRHMQSARLRPRSVGRGAQGRPGGAPCARSAFPCRAAGPPPPSRSFTLISGTVAGLPSISKSFLYSQCLQVKSCTINSGILDISCSSGVSPFGPFGRVFSLNHPREGQPGLFTGFALRTHLVSDDKTGCSL